MVKKAKQKIKKPEITKINGWCFAIVNGKLAEIYFHNDDKKRETKVLGHCYVKRLEFKTKREQNHIRIDTAKNLLIYRKKKYRWLWISPQTRYNLKTKSRLPS